MLSTCLDVQSLHTHAFTMMLRFACLQGEHHPGSNAQPEWQQVAAAFTASNPAAPAVHHACCQLSVCAAGIARCLLRPAAASLLCSAKCFTAIARCSTGRSSVTERLPCSAGCHRCLPAPQRSRGSLQGIRSIYSRCVLLSLWHHQSTSRRLLWLGISIECAAADSSSSSSCAGRLQSAALWLSQWQGGQ